MPSITPPSRSLAAGIFVLAMVATPVPVVAMQVVSPSVTGPVQVEDDDRVTSELANDPATLAAEPSARILKSLQSMIPFDIEGSEIEESLTATVRNMLTGQGDQALTELNDLRQIRSEMPPGELLVAGVFFAGGDATQGRVWLEKSVAEYPDYPTGWTAFARLAISDRRIADAQALLERADRVAQAGTWTAEQNKLFRSEFLDGIIDVAVARGNLSEAKQSLLELKEMTPDNARIPLRLGQVEFDLGDVDASLAYLREAREKAPEIRVPEVILSEWFMRRQNVEESRKWMDQAAADNPDNVDVMVDYARWLLQTEQLPEALEAIDKAGEQSANSFLVQFIKGQIAFARRDYEMAEMHFEALTRAKPGDADATNMLALSLVENPDSTKQERALELAVMNQRMYPRSRTAAATVGWIYYRLGRIPEAENVFRQIAATKAMEPAAAYFVAVYLNNKGDQKNAQTLLERSVASKNYFMFRKAAAELLEQIRQTPAGEQPVTGEPTPAELPDEPDDNGNTDQ